MIENPLVVCRDLLKIHETRGVETVALQGLDLIVAHGELLVIAGPGGSGKTTLINILGGLDRPSAGQVWVDAWDLVKLTNARLGRYRREKVGFIWQDGGRSLVSYLTVLENVRLPMALAGRGGDRRGFAEALLKRVGLGDERHSRLVDLSVAQRQLVAVAAAMANSPKLLLADEPMGELDDDAAPELLAILRQFVEQEEVTVVMTTHDESFAEYADTVLELRDGQIVRR